MSKGFFSKISKVGPTDRLLGDSGEDDQNRILMWFQGFSLNIWDFFQAKNRTNNNVESWHSRFNKFVNQAHLSIYCFILALKQEHESCQAKIVERQNGEPLPRQNEVYRRSNENMRIQGEFHQRQQNPIESYLHPLANRMPQLNWGNRN